MMGGQKDGEGMERWRGRVNVWVRCWKTEK